MKTSIYLGLALGITTSAFAADDAADLAKQLANPVANMVSVPFQLNYDENIGAAENIERTQLNIQPVIPIELSDNWNIISRTILPVVYQNYGNADKDDDWGTGDTMQSFFLSPAKPSDNGIIWGIGPVMLLPTASENTLGADQYGLGPTAVLLKQTNGWTFGALANHVWSVHHDDNDKAVNSTFVQPFINYTFPNSLTLILNSETTYDWNNDEASIPINMLATKVINFNGQLISIGGGARYWAEDTAASPKEWGARLMATFIFPK